MEGEGGAEEHGVHFENHLGDNFQKRLTELMQSTGFADFTIECGTQSWKISSVVIAAHSEFFKSICLGPFAEGQARKVTLVDDDPCAVKAMMEYFCNMGYLCPAGENEFLLHAKVFNLADKYDIEDLRKYVVNACSKRDIAYRPRGDRFKGTGDLIKALLVATEEAYAAAPRDHRLRHIICKLWCNIEQRKIPAYTVASKDDIERLNENAPGFGYDMAHYMATPASLVRQAGWTVNASRVYEYVKASFVGASWSWHDDANDVDVEEVAYQLGIPAEEAHQAGEKIRDAVPKAKFVKDENRNYHGYWTQKSKDHPDWKLPLYGLAAK